MSNLMNCPTCDHEVSSDAQSCPSCGHKLNDSFFEGFFKNTLWIAGIAIVIMIIMAALMGNRPATIVLMSAGMIAGSFGIAALLGIIYRFFTRK